jgi:hypothetical protein
MHMCGLHRKVEVEPIERLKTGLPPGVYAGCTSPRVTASQLNGADE